MNWGRPEIETAPITVCVENGLPIPSVSSSNRLSLAKPFRGRLSYVGRGEIITNVFQSAEENIFVCNGNRQSFDQRSSSIDISVQQQKQTSYWPEYDHHFDSTKKIVHFNEEQRQNRIRRLDTDEYNVDVYCNRTKPDCHYSYMANLVRPGIDLLNSSFESFNGGNYKGASLNQNKPNFSHEINERSSERPPLRDVAPAKPKPLFATRVDKKPKLSNVAFITNCPTDVLGLSKMPTELENQCSQCFFYKPFERTNFNAYRALMKDLPPMQIRYCMVFEKILQPPQDNKWDEIKANTKMKKCCENHAKVFNQAASLRLFDDCYETSVWDYDPKFMHDYLPNTKRGVAKPFGFVWGVTYEEEENKWRKYEHVLQKINEEKIEENILLMTSKGNSKKTASRIPPKLVRMSVDKRVERMTQVIENEVKFPEENVTDEFCGLCGVSFTSVLASMAHYASEKHSHMVNAHFVEGLSMRNVIKPVEQNDAVVVNLIRHFTKKFKTKPTFWQCELCNITLASTEQAEFHFSGASHKRKATQGLSGAQLFLAAKVEPTKEDYEIERPVCRKLRVAPPLKSGASNRFFTAPSKRTSSSVGSSSSSSSHMYVGRFGN